MTELLRLLLGTVIYRPYVYGFFVCFLVFAVRHLRGRGAALYLILAYAIAYLSEYSSTRNGFPFGIYRYFDATRTRELWLSNIPFWDSLSFVFLSYFSWILAASLRKDFRGALTLPSTALLAGLLMMLLDVVIDPLTLLGDRWFLGRIYDYPTGGTYFGVTLANFGGWFFVGTVIPLVFARVSQPARWRMPSPSERACVFGVYAGVFLFNLGITAWIGEWTLLLASSAIAGITLVACGSRLRKQLTA